MNMYELLDKVEKLSYQIESLEASLLEAKAENIRLRSVIETYNKNFLQRAKVMSGEKIALKKEITPDDVKKLSDSGLSYKEIAEKLNCSRSTVWRRLRSISTEII